MHRDHVVKNKVEIKTEKIRQRCGGTDAKNINAPGIQNGVHSGVKAHPVHFLQRQAYLFDIRLHDHGQNVLVSDPVVGDLDALDRSQLIANHLLKGLLHTRIAVVTQLGRKANHRRFADVYGLAQFTGRHKGGLVIGF
ncbi:hypothetical protein SDC9_186853 [bioreactor metagenome]|uniref:Uncharacterized protein n=1 Tax=bioreactor metagenome TaxID=1076179 RepID=A0A645HJY6_9ZZZZ